MYYPATWNDLDSIQGWAGQKYNLVPDVHYDGSQGLQSQIREQILVPDLYVLTVESAAYKKKTKT
jgi:hypothetical protein